MRSFDSIKGTNPISEKSGTPNPPKKTDTDKERKAVIIADSITSRFNLKIL